MDIIINLIIALPSVAMLIFMWLWIFSKQKNASNYNTLLEILDDTDAELAMEYTDAWEYINITHDANESLQSEYDKLFKSYEALQAKNEELDLSNTDICMDLQASQMQFLGALGEIDELKAELEKVNHSIRKRCHHCNTFMTMDGECRNKKCKSKKILNATQAAEVIKAGGCVSTIDGDILDDIHYFSLSLKRNGSIGCYNVSIIPHKGWCFANAQKFIDGMEEKNFIQVYPEFLNGKENHVEAKKAEKPLLANANVGDLCKLKDGKWVQIVRIIENEKYSIVYMYDNVSMTTKINGQYGYWDSNYDIIYTEPLATEGSSEWAKQMLLLGHKITNIDWIEDYSLYHTEYSYLDGDMVKYDDNSSGIPHPITDFLSYGTKKFGWKLYSESKQSPEPETDPKPILTNAEVGDKVRLRNGDVETIFFYASERAFPIIGNTCSWQLNGRFFHVGESEYDAIELIKGVKK